MCMLIKKYHLSYYGYFLDFYKLFYICFLAGFVNILYYRLSEVLGSQNYLLLGQAK